MGAFHELTNLYVRSDNNFNKFIQSSLYLGLD